MQFLVCLAELQHIKQCFLKARFCKKGLLRSLTAQLFKCWKYSRIKQHYHKLVIILWAIWIKFGSYALFFSLVWIILWNSLRTVIVQTSCWKTWQHYLTHKLCLVSRNNCNRSIDGAEIVYWICQHQTRATVSHKISAVAFDPKDFHAPGISWS